MSDHLERSINSRDEVVSRMRADAERMRSELATHQQVRQRLRELEKELQLVLNEYEALRADLKRSRARQTDADLQELEVATLGRKLRQAELMAENSARELVLARSKQLSAPEERLQEARVDMMREDLKQA